MKKLFLIGWLFYSSSAFTGTPSLKSVRVLYQQAPTEEKSCRMLLQLLSSYDENTNPLLHGYKASATMMLAKYTFNPILKLSYFKKGKQMLENAIHTDTGNIELRFLRFAIQTNIPFFLGYHGFIESDKKLLLKSLPTVKDTQLKDMITGYFENCKYVTPNEKQQIE